MLFAFKKPMKSVLLLLSLGFTITACDKPAPNTPETVQTESIAEAKPAKTLAENDNDEQATKQPDDSIMTTNKIATLTTNLGEIKIELNAEKAPLSVANFIDYATSGHYDGTVFHRVIPGFMVQGGGFAPGMQQKPTKTPIQNEANNGLSNETYSVAMARTNAPHSATAQFFINVSDNSRLDFTSESGAGWGYAVFGKVIAGEEIVKQIEAVETGQIGPYGDVPKEDVIIESVTIGN
jgi:peptidyl-prolyl cis-trans isomerase B (cyclophilin B)